MPHDIELNFLCEIFQKSRVPAQVLQWKALVSSDVLEEPEVLTSSLPRLPADTNALLSQTLYKMTDRFRRSFLLLLLDTHAADAVLCIGPYFSEPLTESDLLELGEKNGISPKKQRYFREYLISVPTLESTNPLFTMLHTFCERLWDTSAFSILDLENPIPSPAFSEGESLHSADTEEDLLGIKTMEQRYAFENQIIRAVSLGQLHMESRLFSAFSDNLFEKRHTDPLRNAKNYCIIMNTLLRKAAEDGGVHPIHIDRMSSDFAEKIEKVPALSDISPLMCDMFRAYCRLVRKHSLQKFSFAVQKAILLIDLDLASDITPSELARTLGVSLGYLSTVFKRETGKTLSEHIRERRIGHAKHLLKTTDLQVQTVALHCGIMDVQYFSKIFKRQTGKTPKEYRDAHRASSANA